MGFWEVMKALLYSPVVEAMYEKKSSQELRFADLVLEASRRHAICNEQQVKVKETSFRMLCLLVENGGKIVSRQWLLREVWGMSFDPGTKRIEVQLNYLRRILCLLGSNTEIETHRGKGLRLCEKNACVEF